MTPSRFLTPKERLELHAILKRSRGEALASRRANMLLLLDDGWEITAIAKVLYLDIFTVNSVFKRYKDEGVPSLYAADITGRPTKLNSEQLEVLSNHLETACLSTSHEVRAAIFTFFGINYSKAGVLALLKKLDFCHEATVLVVPVVAENVQQAAIDAYKSLKAALPADEVILHIDGVHPTHMAKSGKIWVKRGQKRHILGNTGRGRVNIHGALNLQTGQFNFMENTVIDAKSTIQLFQKLLQAYGNAKKIHIYLDNARYHYAREVQEWLKNQGKRIVLHFLPPYCPHLNPIERLWHVLHNHVTRNRYYKTFNEFANSVTTFCRETIAQKWETISTYVTDNFTVKSNKNLRMI
jgi:transposase